MTANTIVQGLSWIVVDREGETRAACRFAVDAAGLALDRGPGTAIRFGRRIVLEIEPGMKADRTGEAAGKIADLMIQRVYGKRRSAA